MAYIIAEPCVDVKDKACTSVCPIDCIYQDERMLYINQDECIECGACAAECPVGAIFARNEVPSKWQNYTPLNSLFAKDRVLARAEVTRLKPT